MSLKDMTSEMILAEVQNALRRELEKKPLRHPVYHSGHIVSAIALGERIAEKRIIKLLIDKAIEWRTNDLHQQAGYIDFAIALIKGENK